MALYTSIKGPINYTVAGNPTIEDGIVTNLSTVYNYLILPPINFINNDIDYVLKYSYSEDATNYRNVLLGQFGSTQCQLYISYDGDLIGFYMNGVQVTLSNIRIENYTYFRFFKKGTNLTLALSNDGINWDKSITHTSINWKNFQLDTHLGESTSWSEPNRPNFITLDLNESYINVNNTSWFGTSFGRVKINSGLARYSVIGNPTINDGWASNLSDSNYFQLNSSIQSGWKSIEFCFKINTGTDNNNNRYLISANDDTIIYMDHNGYPQVNMYWRSSAVGSALYGTGGDSFDGYVKYILTPTTAQGFMSTDGINWTLKLNRTGANYTGALTNIRIGKGTRSGGAINLNESYIKVNGSYFWRGDKQDIKSYKIQQDSLLSGYYLIRDGKLLWANPNIYLENTSLSKIDTGISPTDYSSLNFTLKTSVTTLGTSTSQTPVIFGSNTGDVSYIGYRVDDSKYLCGGSYRNFGTKITDINYLTGTISNYGTELSLTDNNITITCSGGSSANYNYNLFCTGTENPADYRYAKARIYSGMTMSANGIKLRHFVPVPKGLLIGNFVVPSNGMFDIITQTFFENKGTGEFEIGGIPDEYIIESGKMIWCNPDIYLESTGTQYIDTGIKSNSELEVQLKWYQVSGQVFGNLETSGGINKSFGLDSTSAGGYFRVGTGYYQGSSDTYAVPGWHTIQGNKTTFIRDGKINTLSGSTFSDSNNTITLFNYRGGSQRLTGKITYFILSKNNLLQYLVPVPKGLLIGNKVAPSNCMFDLVTQTFFENQGTGTFTIGGITNDYLFCGKELIGCDNNIYLESTGTQHIDTGISGFIDWKLLAQKVSGSGTFMVVAHHTGAGKWFGGQGTYWGPGGNIYSSTNDTTKADLDVSFTSVGVSGKIAEESFYRAVAVSERLENYGLFNWVTTNTTYAMKGKIFKAEGYKNSKLLRYFVPVPTGMIINGKTAPSNCMYDLVSKQFFINKGTGSFTYGKDS